MFADLTSILNRAVLNLLISVETNIPSILTSVQFSPF